MTKSNRNITIIISLILTSIYTFGQSCLPNGITFNNQVQIDSFSYNYPGCREIEGNLNITGNNIFNLLGLNQLERVDKSVIIVNTDSLVSLQGLNNLVEIKEQLWIGYWGPNDNKSLESVNGLESLRRIGLGLTIAQNPKLENLIGFDSLRYVYNLYIGPNESLTSLNGLISLDTIDYELIISGANSLNSIEGLNNLSYINHSLQIMYNESLTSLFGLENLNETSVNWFLKIADNPTLSQCEAESICNLLTDTTTIISICNNNNGCNSIDEVKQACLVKSPIHNYNEDNISIYPNPTIDKLRIVLKDEIKIIETKVLDINGKLKLKYSDQRTDIDLSNLNSGIYIIEIKTSNRINREKIIKH